MRVLVTGAGGQVGIETLRVAAEMGIGAVGLARVDLDVTDSEAVRQAVDRHVPDVVVHAAAYTAVDRAESEPDLAFAVNQDGAGHVAIACDEARIPLIHLSTDYVFDGEKGAPYVPGDPMSPVNVYGASKAAGEAAVRDRLARHAILRTAWVFSAHGHNFVKTMLRLATERDRLAVVADQWGHPTWAGDVARSALAAAARAVRGELQWGTYHVAGSPLTTWHGLATAVIDEAAAQGVVRSIPVDPILTESFPTPAKRPRRVELETVPSMKAIGVHPFRWEEALSQTVGDWSRSRAGRRQ